MNDVDTIEVTVRVAQPGVSFVEGVTGVTMTQTVTIAPANVMYYEDDFTGEGAITYYNTGSDLSGNIWAVYEGDYKGYEQSSDQDMNYGTDPNYAENGSLIWDALFLSYLEGADQALLPVVGADIAMKAPCYVSEDRFALYGDASNDTIHAMTVNHAGAATVMSFEFRGTGFEIIGRTTVSAYSVLTVKIENLDNGEMTAIPVITAGSVGDLTQVPVVASKGLAYGNYRVTVITSNVRGEDRMVYVDGIRVYQPLTAQQAAVYYKESESAAEFYEIKELIQAGSLVYGDIDPIEEENGSLISWNFGTTMIENFRPDDEFGDYILVGCDNVTDYLTYGPNNEIYLSNANGASLSYIAFYVVLDESYQGERSIQVGAHMKSYDEAYNMGASLRYGNTAEDFLGDENAMFVVSGTEQYYTIDIDWAPVNNNGIEQTLVIIGIDNADNDVLALTNLKLNGYKIASHTAAELVAVRDMYDINACTLMSRVVAIGEALANKQ